MRHAARISHRNCSYSRMNEMLFYSKSFKRIINARPRLCMNCRSMNSLMCVVACTVNATCRTMVSTKLLRCFHSLIWRTTLLWCLQGAFVIFRGTVFENRNWRNNYNNKANGRLVTKTTKCNVQQYLNQPSDWTKTEVRV